MKFTAKVSDFSAAYKLTEFTLDRKRDNQGSLLYMEAYTSKPQRVLLYSGDNRGETLIRVPATVKEAGPVLVYPKDLMKSLATLPEEAELSFQMTAAGRLSMKCGNFNPSCAVAGEMAFVQNKIKSMPLTAEPVFQVPCWKLADVLERTVYFVMDETDTSQYNLHNIRLELDKGVLYAYASNNKVLAAARINGLAEDKALNLSIPGTAVPSLLRILSRFKASDEKVSEAKVILGKNVNGDISGFYIMVDNICYGTVLSAYQLPDAVRSAEQAAKGHASIMLDRKGMLDTLSRCHPFVKDHKEMRISLEDNALTIYDEAGAELDKIQGAGTADGKESAVLDINYCFGVLKASKEEIVTGKFWKHPQREYQRALIFQSGDDTQGRSFYMVSTLYDPAKKEAPEQVPAAA